jgi:hypothetical protein
VEFEWGIEGEDGESFLGQTKGDHKQTKLAKDKDLPGYWITRDFLEGEIEESPLDVLSRDP